MKKTFMLLAVLAVSVSSMFAQLSTRDNDATNVNLGARPVAGDAALTFTIPIVGRSGNNGEDAGLYNGNLFGAGQVLTFRYYNTSDVAYRLGIHMSADNNKRSGEQTDEDLAFAGDVREAEYQDVMREYLIAPGIEKHFSSSNIWDVYAGGDVLIGFNKEKNMSNEIYWEDDGGDLIEGGRNFQTSTTNAFVFGLGGVVGMNIFVAQLPVSVGIEYGLSAKWLFGDKTKVETEFAANASDDVVTNEYYEDPDDLGNIYTDFSKRQFNMDTNHNVRLNINFYFSR
jgi:hypothetical protein